MTDLLNEPVYTKTQTLTVVPLLDTILEVQEEAPIDQVMESPPAATTNTPPTNSSQCVNEVKNQLPKFVPKSISGYVQPRLERTCELKYQLYEKIFQTAEYLNHDSYRALYDALQESMRIDELQERYESSQPSRKKRSQDDQDPLENREEEKKMKRRKGDGQSSSKKGKVTAEFKRVRKELKNFLSKASSMNSLMRTRIQGNHYHWKDLLANFLRLNQNDIEDLYLLKIQDKIHNIDGVGEYDLINALQLYIRRIMIKKRVSYTTMSHPRGVVYLGNDKQKMLMRADEIHKFSDRTLNKVYDKLDVMLRDNKLGYGNVGMKDRALVKERQRKDKVDTGKD
ncbi:hypothetical protein Tco_1320862 [Tanacetum coccineum]